MTTPYHTDDSDDPKRVQDEEGTVDRKLKERILNARQRVDDAEFKLFVDAPVAGSRMGEAGKSRAWGVAVRQYLRAIEPILRSEDVAESQYYYNEVKLGEPVKLVPPDTDDYPFSEFHRSDVTPVEFKLQNGIPTDVDLPTPKHIRFHGLRSVIEAPEILAKTWTVSIGMWEEPLKGGTVETTAQRPVPREIYGRAVREADTFLQRAGVGLDISGSGGEWEI